jgi:outer membrane protein OmpA-like peptidoglycan-associated protein
MNLNAQVNPLTPDMLTNRQMGYLNDASAVQWNPALLGVRSSSDLLLSLPLSNQFDISGSQYGLFAKFGHLGFGYISEYNDSLLKLPQSLYTGYGIQILRDHLWLGGSVFYSGNLDDTLTTFRTFRYASSIIFSPVNWLITTIGVSNLPYSFENLIWNIGAIYSPLEWLSIHANIGYSPEAKFRNNSSISPDIAVSFGGMGNYLIPSISYNYNSNMIRLGAELSLGALSVGILPKLNNGSFSGHTTFLRLSNDYQRNVAALSGRYSLSGTTGADGCLEDAIMWNFSNQSDSPVDLMNILQNKAGSYSSLFKDLKKLGPTDDIFNQIGIKYYNEKPPEIVKSNTDFIFTNNNNPVVVESIDSTHKPVITSIIKVKDSFGRNVPDLKKNDFFLKDTNFQIVSLDQTISTEKIKVDIVILQDCSGSMQSIIDAVKRNVISFVNSINSRGADCHIGGILYGEEIYDILEPTADMAKFNKFYSVAAATAPGEVSSIAIDEASKMDFRDGAKRIFILLSDECTMQNNSTLTEADLVYSLWGNSASLYAVINPAEHNAGVLTRLTLGREYNIYSPFTAILEKISGDITTTYQLSYKPKEKIVVKKSILFGLCKDEDNWKVPAEIKLNDNSGKTLKIIANKITGEYETEIEEGKIYTVLASHPDYIDINESLDLTNLRKGDTVEKNFIFKIPVTTINGVINNEIRQTINASINIEIEETSELVTNLQSDDKGYSSELKEGKKYLVTAKAPDYIPMTKELDATAIKRGSKMTLDFELVSIQDAIDRGTIFKLENIFFDTNKWDIKSESEPEIMKLVDFMKEYSIVRVEVSAHTDAVGSDKANQTLSDNRAKSVVDYLILKGIAQDRLVWKGYGESIPVATNDTDEGRALNRRVEFKLIK